MRILMLGNSFTFANDLPQILAELTEAEVVHHTRGGSVAVGAAEPGDPPGRPDPSGADGGAMGLCGPPGDEPRPRYRPQKFFLQCGMALRADPDKGNVPDFVCYMDLPERRGQASGQELGL